MVLSHKICGNFLQQQKETNTFLKLSPPHFSIRQFLLKFIIILKIFPSPVFLRVKSWPPITRISFFLLYLSFTYLYPYGLMVSYFLQEMTVSFSLFILMLTFFLIRSVGILSRSLLCLLDISIGEIPWETYLGKKLMKFATYFQMGPPQKGLSLHNLCVCIYTCIWLYMFREKERKRSVNMVRCQLNQI